MFKFHSITCSWPVSPAPLIEETVIFPLYIFAYFIKDKLPIGVLVYLWGIYFLPLLSIFVFVPVQYCLDDCRFVVESEVCSIVWSLSQEDPDFRLGTWNLIPPVPFFFLKISLTIQGLLWAKYLKRNFLKPKWQINIWKSDHVH